MFLSKPAATVADMFHSRAAKAAALSRPIVLSTLAFGALSAGLVPGQAVPTALGGQSTQCFAEGERQSLYSWTGFFVFVDDDGDKRTRYASGSVYASSKEEARSFAEQQLAEQAHSAASIWDGEVTQMGITSMYEY